MKKAFSLWAMLTVLLFSLSSCFPGYERIDAGCEGIKVKLYGDDKGVGEVSMCTGAVWYNMITEDVFEYPTYVQTVDYEEFSTNSSEGSEFKLNPQLLIKIQDGHSPQVFKKYRKSMDELLKTVILKYVKDACRIQINKYEADYIISHREDIETAIEKYLNNVLTQEHFELESMTSGLKYPESIVASVDAKTKAIQDAQRVENEIRVSEAAAKKRIIEAEAEAEANRLKAQALTPAILEKMWIEKWDGKLPVYGQVPTIFKDISK